MGLVGQSYQATWSASVIQAPSPPGSSMNIHDNLSWGLVDTSGAQTRQPSHGGQEGNTRTTSPSNLPSATTSGGQMTQSSKWTSAVSKACEDEWTL